MQLNEIQSKYIKNKLDKLKKSKFRSSFHLTEKDKKYIAAKVFSIIESHCEDFIKNRLASFPTLNDGKQTPMKGHPVFVAQHATATCCRKCLNKWHKIPSNRPLTAKEIRFVVALIMEWIKNQ